MSKKDKHAPIGAFTTRIGYDAKVTRGDTVLVPINITVAGYVTIKDAEALQDLAMGACQRAEAVLDPKDPAA